MRKRILISAYAVSPYKGSEYAVAWSFITNIAKYHDVWVLYGISDYFMGDTQTMRKYLLENKVENVEFIEIKGGKRASAIVLLDKIGLGWFFYFAFPIWQKKAYKAAKKLVKEKDIHVVHQLGPIGFREPGYLWKLNLPFVWGPIGGTKIIDLVLLKDKPFKAYFIFFVKNLINKIQLRFSARIKKAISASNVLLSATTIDQKNILKYFNRNSYHFTENGLLENVTTVFNNIIPAKDKIKFVWCGVLNYRKNLELALTALSKLEQTNWELHVIGSGPLQEKLSILANTLNIQNNIKWYGHIPRTEVLDVMSKSHLHLITSVSEENTTVLFEAMSFGIPTLTIDHCGMADIVNEDCGIKIKVNNFETMASEIANKLAKILENPNYLKKITEGVKLASQQYTWGKRMCMLNQYYNEAIENWTIKNGQ